MRKSKLVLLFMLLVLLLSVGPGAVLAQEPPPVDSTVAPELSPQQSPPQPLWWARIRANHWEFPWSDWRPHVLAVWNFPYCHDQQYHGPGGYADTCSSSHGCIDQWTWWLKDPQSKLGVPGSWWLGKPERRDIYNYSAVCWIY